MLRKEIALVKRKLNQEKRQLSESSGKSVHLVIVRNYSLYLIYQISFQVEASI